MAAAALQSRAATAWAATARRWLSSATVAQPSRTQLWHHALTCAVPMVGFGFMDNTVMLRMGNTLDCTIGVTFGLSTLSAAAMGQMCSDVAGIVFGDTVERACRACGLPASGLTLEQRRLPICKRVALLGSCVGVVSGCCLGMINLLFMDTGRAQQLKSEGTALEEVSRATSLSMHGYALTMSNVVPVSTAAPDEGAEPVVPATCVTVRGPAPADRLALRALSVARDEGCDVVSVTAGPAVDAADIDAGKDEHAMLQDGSLVQLELIIRLAAQPLPPEAHASFGMGVLQAIGAPPGESGGPAPPAPQPATPAKEQDHSAQSVRGAMSYPSTSTAPEAHEGTRPATAPA